MESLIGVLVGIGLSAASGLRVFIPLLGMSAAGHYGLIPLNESFAWLASWQAMLAFGVASLLEVGAYYVPWLDHALDVVLVRAAVGIPTGGLANPIVSSGEGIGSIVLTLLALFIPVLAIIVAIWLVYRGLKRLYYFKTNT